MSSKNPTIKLYSKIALIANEMLQASKIQDWETLKMLEAKYIQHLDELKEIEQSVTLTQEERTQKVNFIHTILATDKQIRNEIEPWMERLSLMMNTTKTQSKLNKIYGNKNGM